VYINIRKASLFGLVVATAAATSTAALAEDGRFYINPAIGYQDFDSDRNLDGEMSWSLGGEYRFGRNWAAELRYFDTEPEFDKGNGDADVSQYYLDGLYYFSGQAEKWQPFALLGVGRAEFDSSRSDTTETQSALGGGVRYAFTDNWSLRADVRAIYGFDDSNWDSMVNVGISYAFGSLAATAAVVVPAVTVPVALDSDGDGVIDENDRCLNTPAGVVVNAEGCVLTRAKEVSFDLSLRFAHDSDVVETYDNAELEKVATYLGEQSTATGVIEGHTDNTGNAVYNKKLSERRARAVEKLLVEKYGVTVGRISSAGYGEERPIADNNTAEGRHANRRVVVKVTNTEQENVLK